MNRLGWGLRRGRHVAEMLGAAGVDPVFGTAHWRNVRQPDVLTNWTHKRDQAALLLWLATVGGVVYA